MCEKSVYDGNAADVQGADRKELQVTEPSSGPGVNADARPRLPHGVRLVHSEAQGGWVLLAPERVFKADAIAAEIIKRCTGEATFAAIVDDLVKTYSAPRERITTDVSALLRTLADKKLLEL
jgi:pyrroloquinoline quinone biosynthesis protein D